MKGKRFPQKGRPKAQRTKYSKYHSRIENNLDSCMANLESREGETSLSVAAVFVGSLFYYYTTT